MDDLDLQNKNIKDSIKFVSENFKIENFSKKIKLIISSF